MPKYLIVTLLGILLCGGIYLLGKKDCQNQYLTNQQEHKKNVIHQKAQIYSRPNADRDTLLKLMYDGSL